MIPPLFYNSMFDIPLGEFIIRPNAKTRPLSAREVNAAPKPTRPAPKPSMTATKRLNQKQSVREVMEEVEVDVDGNENENENENEENA